MRRGSPDVLELADGARISYRCESPDSAPGTALLIGGLGDDHHCWDGQASRLLEIGWRVVRADNRGSGASDAPLVGLTIARMADDLAAILDAQSLDGAVVAGTSMGGFVAQTLAARHPGRVAALALVATAPHLPVAARLALGLWRDLVRSGARGLRMALLDTCLHGFSGTWIERNADKLAAWTEPGSRGAEALLAQIEAMLDFEPVTGLPEVRTLVVHGREDMLMPLEVARGFEQLCPRATFTVLACGHAVAIEQTAAFNDALVRFISRETTDGRVQG